MALLAGPSAPLLGLGTSSQRRFSSPASADGAPSGLLAARLQELQQCRDQRLITIEEHAEARQRLLDSYANLEATQPLGLGVDTEEQASLLQPSGSGPLMAAPRPPPPRPRAARAGGGPLEGSALRRLLLSVAGLKRCAGMDDLPKRISSCGSWPEQETEVVDEGEFWVDVLGSLKRQASGRSQAEGPTTLTELQTEDITAGRVQELFLAWDTDCDGTVSRSELCEGLRSIGVHIDEEACLSIMRHVARRGGRRDAIEGINIDEFDLILTRLRLAWLFAPTTDSCCADRLPSALTICDYDAKAMRTDVLDTGTGDFQSSDMRRFFFEPRERLHSSAIGGWPNHAPTSLRSLSAPFSTTVRWVHVDASQGLDELTLRRLAAKYRLHPLAVEDVMDKGTPTKIDRFASHYFISVDIMSLADNGDFRNMRVQVLRSNVSIFLTVPPQCDTLLTIIQNRRDSSSWLATWCSADDAEPSAPDLSLWWKLVEDLQHTPVRRMREHRADFLLYEVLDRIVDQLRPVSEAYSRRLGHMHQTPMAFFPQDWLDELDEVKLELVDLARSIRPLRQVVRHIINDVRIGGDAKTYLEDVEDAIDQTLGDISQLQEMCRTLAEAHEGYLDKRMNATLFVLSVFSAIFLPAQFITGVFGMNFVEPDGTPSMPELEWQHGYQYFWALQAGIMLTGLTAAVFLHQVGLSCFETLPCCTRCRTPKHRRHGGRPRCKSPSK